MGYALPIQELNQLHARETNSDMELQLQRELMNNKYLELKLSQELQAKLDIHSIIRHFSSTLSHYIDHSGIQVMTTESKVVTIEGRYGHHRESVDLILDDEKFGTVILMGREPINKWSAIFFRYLARYLVYPIKNALLIQSLKMQTITDPLTGALNRTALEHDLSQEIEVAARYDSLVAVAMLDIDHFKRVNDTYGHAAGDRILTGVAKQIQKQIRSADSLYRYGGEEFTLLMRNTSLENAKNKLESILDNIGNGDWNDVDPELKITLSAGVTIWDGEEHGKALIKQADQALYYSKSNGRNQVNCTER